MTNPVTTHQAEEDARNETIQIFINGHLLPNAQALVSVMVYTFPRGIVGAALRSPIDAGPLMARRFSRRCQG